MLVKTIISHGILRPEGTIFSLLEMRENRPPGDGSTANGSRARVGTQGDPSPGPFHCPASPPLKRDFKAFIAFMEEGSSLINFMTPAPLCNRAVSGSWQMGHSNSALLIWLELILREEEPCAADAFPSPWPGKRQPLHGRLCGFGPLLSLV